MTEHLKTIEEMQAEVLSVNVANGWFDGGRSFGDGIALLHSEVSEAFEAYRDHGFKDATVTYPSSTENVKPPLAKPEGVGSEMADIFIRLLDECERSGIDLRAEYERKIAFNRTRGWKHGGKNL